MMRWHETCTPLLPMPRSPGSKRWRLYKPLEGFELPNECSGDLPQEVSEAMQQTLLSNSS